MSRYRGRTVAARLDGARRPSVLSGRAAVVEPPAPPAAAEQGAWYHVGPVRHARRAELVPAEGDPATDPATDPAADPAADPSTDATVADVYVYDSIGGWWGVSADDFVRDVAALEVERIVLHLNSPGGDVWDGAAIANMLRQHRAEVVISVDGVAASAASVIAMAGDVIVMGVGSTMMIHDAWTMVAGNPAELRHEADVLDSLSNSIAETYVARAGGTVPEWRAIMAEEGWYTATEAVAAGLADRVAGPEDRASSTGQTITPGGTTALDNWWWDAWDSLGQPERHSARLGAYRHAGRAEAPAPPIPSQQAGPESPAAPASGSTPTQRGGSAVELTDEQVGQVRTQLGLPENATRQEVQAALDARLATAASTEQLPPGFVPIEQATFEQLQAQARRGDEARAEQLRVERFAEIDAAVADGRIARAAVQTYRDQTDPAQVGDVLATRIRETLARLPKGAIPVGGALGYTGAGNSEGSAPSTLADVQNDATYKSWRI